MPWKDPEKKREYDRRRESARPPRNRVYTRESLEAAAKRVRQRYHYTPKAAPTLTRVCRACGEEKLNQEFYRNKGYQCKECNQFHNRRVRQLRLEHSPPAPGGSCPICNEEVQRWVLDHCHISGQFRGWICGLCNTGIGNLRDDVDNLKRAAQYIENWLRSPGPTEAIECYP